MAKFVGREAEIGLLEAAFSRAVRVPGPQAVTMIGPLGVGKTRLVDEWLSTKSAAQVRVVRGRVDGTCDALMARLLRARFGLGELSAERALPRFAAELQTVFGDRRVAEVAALLGGFLGFELPDSPLLRVLTGRPDQGAELTRAVLARFFEQDAVARPVVIVVEDVHDADDRSLDLLHGLVDEMQGARVLVVATARPELLVRRPGWRRTGGRRALIDLPPLSAAEIDALIAGMLPSLVTPAPDPALCERAAVEAGGNPFLLEQLLSLYGRYGAAITDTADGVRLDDTRAEAEVVALTGEDAAAARVAGLTAAERDVLARGAVFGGVFWTGGVVALGRLDGPTPEDAVIFAPDPTIAEINQILESLAGRKILKRLPDTAAMAGETAWGFRHVLEERLIGAGADPALARRRKAFAAQWLESRAGDEREQRLEPLARLYDEAGDKRRAAYCYLSAASVARDRLLIERARLLYLAGIQLCGDDDAVAKLDALYAAGDLTARLGHTREAIALFQDMLLIAWRLDLPAKGGAAHGRIGRLFATLGEHARGRTHLETAHTLFEAAGDWAGVAAALDDIGRIHFQMGAPDRSIACHIEALAVRERLGDDRGRALTLSRLGQVHHDGGALATAGEHFAAALDVRRRIGDRPGVVASLLDLGALERDFGRLPAALACLGEGRELARASGERLYEASLTVAIGDCRLTQGQAQEAWNEFRAAREIARQFGARVLLADATRGQAEAELALGDARRARDHARSAFEIADRAGVAPLAGAALRVMASAVGWGAPGEAELGGAREMFDRAVELLTASGAELELGRAFVAYADFEQRVGRADVADELRRHVGTMNAVARRSDPGPRADAALGEPAP